MSTKGSPRGGTITVDSEVGDYTGERWRWCMTVMALGVNDEPDVETMFPQRAARSISPVAG
jgi:hypothetical protein